MRKRNKHFLKEKEYRRLIKRLDEIRTIQRNLGWVELEVPQFIGWTAKIQPRQDILNRQDDWVFIGICDLYSTTSFAKKIEYFEWNKKRHNPKDRFVVYSKPHIRSIHEWEYQRLVPQAKRWFKLDEFSGSSWRGCSYYCTIPNFYWEIIYEKNYKTKVKVSDVLLEQEEAEIKSKINSDFYWENEWCKGAPKDFRNRLNRSQRAKSKKTLHNIWKKGIEDSVFEDNYRGARWLWW